MPRPLRIELENAFYHVINVGANKQTIFEKNSHKRMFFKILGEIVEKFKIEIHCFCLIRTHYHLIIKTPYANLSKAMRHLNSVYTRRLNGSINRDGPLFRGRYKAVLIQSEEYLLQVSRYIHFIPVIAKLCKDPLNYRWSSYRAYIIKNSFIFWLTTSFILNKIISTYKKKSYLAFMQQGIDKKIYQFYLKKHLPSIIGTTKFIETHLNNLNEKYKLCVSSDINQTKLLPSKEIILNEVMSFFKISKNELYASKQGKKNIPRLISIYLLAHQGQITHKLISDIFDGLKENSISSLIYRLKKMIMVNYKIKKWIDDLIINIDKQHF